MNLPDPRLTPAKPDLAAAHLRGIFAATSFVEGTLMQVHEEVLDLRGAPARDANVVTQAIYGEAVMVYEDEEGWAWGQLMRDGYVGYLSATGLSKPGPPATDRVCVARTFAYPAANIKAPIETALPMGATLAIVGREGAFARTCDNRFVLSAHLAPLDAVAIDYVEIAEWFMHTPYLWGGKTKLGLDCSGLIQIALQAAGFAAPRDSDMLEKFAGADVPGSTLQRGDLVFWRGHIGVMRDDATLLHANGHHMMVVSEPLQIASARILAQGGGAVRGLRRLRGLPDATHV